MGIMNVFRENYLEWDEYQQLIQQKEEIDFMHQTAIKSLKNKTTKEDDEDGY